jgi:hypothetical protein
MRGQRRADQGTKGRGAAWNSGMKRKQQFVASDWLPLNASKRSISSSAIPSTN